MQVVFSWAGQHLYKVFDLSTCQTLSALTVGPSCGLYKKSLKSKSKSQSVMLHLCLIADAAGCTTAGLLDSLEALYQAT